LHTGLPFPSYDLWEEKYSVTTYTASAAFGGLIAAGNFAKTLGKTDDASKFYSEAESLRKSIISKLWDDKEKYFFKLIGDELVKDANIDASSFYEVFRFGVLSVDDSRMQDFFDILMKRLNRGIKIGGIARYEGDAYCRVNNESAGNPWPVVSLWMVQYNIAKANSLSQLQESLKDLEWIANLTKSSMLPEQFNPWNGEHISATPLTWSHAEFVHTVLEYDRKLKALNR